MTGVARIGLWVMSTLTVLVLLFGYHTSTSSQPAPGSSVVAPGSGFSATTSDSAAGSGSATGSGTTGTGTTVTGPVSNTQWGPVQVQITVANGSLTGVTVLQYPTGNGRDQEINDYALPILVQETVDAQNANIDMVSGATVTSEGYLESLQAALDQAGR